MKNIIFTHQAELCDRIYYNIDAVRFCRGGERRSLPGTDSRRTTPLVDGFEARKTEEDKMRLRLFMLCVLCASALCADIQITAPGEGESVPQLWPEEISFFEMSREQRRNNRDKGDSTAVKALKARRASARPVVVSWKGSTGPCMVKIVRLPDGKVFHDSIAAGTSVAITGRLEIARRWKATVSDGASTATVTFATEDRAPRIVTFDGVPHARDIGGRIGLGGRRVKQGLVFRTSGLNNNAKAPFYTYDEVLKLHDEGRLATAGTWKSRALGRRYEAQLKSGKALDPKLIRLYKHGPVAPGTERLSVADRTVFLDFLGVKSDIDFRDDWECFGMTGSPLGDSVNWYHYPMYSGYGGFISPKGRATIALTFDVFRAKSNYPIVFHCIGGMDRTGTFAFLLNALLGVDEEELVRDYETTFLLGAGMDELHAKWLDGLIKAVHELPGDTLADKMKRYFISLGFTEEQVEWVREFLLEPAACPGTNRQKTKVHTVTEKTGAAIQSAIDTAATAGGGRVIVPAGEYPTKMLRLKSHVELHLEKGAVVKASTNRYDYVPFPREMDSAPTADAHMGLAFIQAWDAEDIAITGEGAFDGNGQAFFNVKKGCKGRFYEPIRPRPKLMAMKNCRNVRFEGVSFNNSSSWTIHLRQCENLDFRKIKVVNNVKFINADGIDFDGCRHVRVTDSDFLTGDDSISIRAIAWEGEKDKVVSEDFLVENCRIESGCQCIRIGCPSDDTIRDIHFRNLKLKGFNGINFDYPFAYLRPNDEGRVDIHDVTFENVTGSLDGIALRIEAGPGVKIRGVRDVVFRNFDVKSQLPLVFKGNVYSRIERIWRENFTFNGERLPDGEITVDCTSEKPLCRPQPGKPGYKPPVSYVPPVFVTVEEKSGEAIQRAIDTVAANATGGRVTVPAGLYPCRSLRMRSHVELRLEKGAVIQGGTSSSSYFSFPDEVCAIKPEKSAKVFIYAWDAVDIAITGEGTVDGQGLEFFDRKSGGGHFFSKPPCERPRLLQFVRCRGVRLDGVTFLNSPNWTMLIRLCEDVAVDGVRIRNDQRMINSDGIDFDGCRRVRMAHCDFVTGDDSVILRAIREKDAVSPVVCEDILAKDCLFDSACQIIRVGCPSDDTIRNARFRDIKGKGRNGIYFNYPKRYLSTDGSTSSMDVHDIIFERFSGDFYGSAIQIDVDEGVRLRGVRSITFRDFDVTSKQPLRFVGNVLSPMEHVVLENVKVNGKTEKNGEVVFQGTKQRSSL